MEQPLVSIIMGAYNGEKTISRCIESIINQTYTNWEFIICNDCSTDNTLKIINEYSERDSRIIILNNDRNIRLAASLNRCLDVAKGKYVARMDADDESLPSRLEVQVKYLEEHPDVDCVGVARIVFDEYGEHGIRRENEYPSKNDLLYMNPFAHPTIMMKKSVYNELQGYTVSEETMRAEDLDLWFRFYEKEYNGYNIQTPLYRYREGLDDYSKRTIKAGIGTSKVYWNGLKRLNVKWYKRIVAFKPIITAIIPDVIMHKYHSSK